MTKEIENSLYKCKQTRIFFRVIRMENANFHKAKCRCCGKNVENGEKLRKLTSKIEQDFKNLTQLEVKTGNFADILSLIIIHILN